MTKFRWLVFPLLVGIQCIFPSVGDGADASRTLTVAPSQGSNETKVAVVIGNNKYPSGALINPVNDAKAMAGALRKLGFDVELKLDASKADMGEVFRRFSKKAEKATVAALFYAGHSIQVNGNNYIVPIDANPESERDLKRDMVKMDDVIDDMGDAKVKLVFFDACRNNPLARSFSRGGARGLAAPVEATGTLISFATKHGNTASDGEGAHSPYTTALLSALENPTGLEIEQLLRKVQQGVKSATNGQQEPWRYGSLDGDFFFKANDPMAAAKAQQDALDRAVQQATQKANEQSAREKAELKAQQEASQRTAQLAEMRANELAAKERTEFEKSLRAQKEASERSANEAIRHVKEQAAKETAEVKLAMAKMVQEALSNQAAALDAERKATERANGKPIKSAPPEIALESTEVTPPRLATQSTAGTQQIASENKTSENTSQHVVQNAKKSEPSVNPLPLAMGASTVPLQSQKQTRLALELPKNDSSGAIAPLASSQLPRQQSKSDSATPVRDSIQIASIAPTKIAETKVADGKLIKDSYSSVANDEWEYLSKDKFGKQHKLVSHVKAVVDGTGVLENVLMDGSELGEWVLTGKPFLTPIKTDSLFLFSAHWNGEDISDATILNGSICGRTFACRLSAKIHGAEKITVPAGSFETTIIEISLTPEHPKPSWIKLKVWYSFVFRRVIRQTVTVFDQAGYMAQLFGGSTNETIELIARRNSGK